ncbi:MAG TPA: alpha/beta fold hydrolase [Solirubrobacterales bacterium]|nr:alpha/beta fold hydrolase [Solirubrobacterales bacterium]
MRVADQLWIDHFIQAPLDHGDPGGERIEVYAREVVDADRANESLPVLLYLQGGPGHASDRPGPGHGWLGEALRDYRVLFMDSRGTGRSTPVNAVRLAARGSVAEQARYLTHFRADSIVADAELLRRELIGDGRFTLLAQSFGGWCAMTYLSFAPDGLANVYICGGLPSLTASADDVYRAAYPRLINANAHYFDRFPEDRDRLHRLCGHLERRVVRLPRGERLSARRLRTLGIQLGLTDGFDRLHFLLESAFPGSSSAPVPGDGFLAAADALLSFAGRPLFCVLHEAVYCQGRASRWAAQRIGAEFPQFGETASVPLFTGEMIFPWYFEEDPTLRPFAEIAEALAEYEGWTPLYDRAALADNRVPVRAVVYARDLFVDAEMSMRAAAEVANTTTWLSEDLEHDALRKGQVFERLLAREPLA